MPRKVRSGLTAVLVALLVGGTLGSCAAKADPQQRVDDAIAKAQQKITSQVQAENKQRKVQEATLEKQMDSFASAFSTAMESGKLDSLESLMNADVKSDVEFSDTADAWRGTGPVKVDLKSVGVPMLQVPRVESATVPTENAGAFADSFHPMVRDDRGRMIRAESYEPDHYQLPTSTTVRFSVNHKGAKVLNLSMSGGKWVISGGDLLAQIPSSVTSGGLNGIAFSGAHLVVGKAPLRSLLPGAQDDPPPILIGKYDLVTSKGYDASVLAYPDLHGIDIHATIPIPQLTDGAKKKAVSHVDKIVSAGIAATGDESTCQAGFDLAEVPIDGVKEVLLTGCAAWYDSSADKLIQPVTVGNTETSINWRDDNLGGSVSITLTGTDAKPLFAISRVHTLTGRENETWSWGSATVNMNLNANGGFDSFSKSDFGGLQQ